MKKNNQGIAVKIYKIGRWFFERKIPIIPYLCFRINLILCNCSIPISCKIGCGVVMPHSIGIVLHQNSIIGENTIIYQHVTVGNANGPVIGKNCIIGAGACILGNITIGDNCKIGANAVVLKDIPNNCTAVGVPAKIVRINGKNVCNER